MSARADVTPFGYGRRQPGGLVVEPGPLGQPSVVYVDGYVVRFAQLSDARDRTRSPAILADVGAIPRGLVALGRDRYALLLGDGGYLLDLALEARPRALFCVVPEREPYGERLVPVATALAFDRQRGRLYAHVLTYSGRDIVANEIAAYDADDGADLERWPLSTAPSVSLVAVLPTGELVVASQTELVLLDPTSGRESLIALLADLEVGALVGLVWDPATSSLLALDASHGLTRISLTDAAGARLVGAR